MQEQEVFARRHAYRRAWNSSDCESAVLERETDTAVPAAPRSIVRRMNAEDNFVRHFNGLLDDATYYAVKSRISNSCQYISYSR